MTRLLYTCAHNPTNPKGDPLFPTPNAAIAARADLMPVGPPPHGDGRGPRPGGAVDAKITSGAMARAMTVNAVSG